MSTILHQPIIGVWQTTCDVLLFNGDCSWFFWVCLCGFCAGNIKAIIKQSPEVRFAQGLVLAVLTSYGGGTLAAIFSGLPIPFFLNQAFVPMVVAVWALCFLLPKQVVKVMDTDVGALVISICFETMRCHVMMNSQANCATALENFGTSPAPLVGPIIAGVIGGCGGAFMPLDKGLKPLEGDLTWRMKSAVIGSFFLQLVLRDPYTKPLIVELLPFLADARTVRAIVCVFFVFTPILSFAKPDFLPFGANPLLPPTKPSKLAAEVAVTKKTK